MEGLSLGGWVGDSRYSEGLMREPEFSSVHYTGGSSMVDYDEGQYGLDEEGFTLHSDSAFRRVQQHLEFDLYRP